MSEFFKSKSKMSMIFGAVFLVVTLVAGSMANLVQAFADDPTGNNDVSTSTVKTEKTSLSSKTADNMSTEIVIQPEKKVDDPTTQITRQNIPGEMRGVFLTPGEDFLTGDFNETKVKAEIDQAIADVKELTMNTIIVDTSYNDYVIYRTAKAPELSGSFDVMEYIVKKAREAGLYTYAIFDVSLYDNSKTISSTLAIGATTLNSLSSNLREFTEKYNVDGLLIDGYHNVPNESSYGIYSLTGGAIGYDNFMKKSPEAMVTSASSAVRTYSPGTQVGLLANAVWQNSGDDAKGSNTTATFTSLGSGNADTKSYVENGLVDFVAVKAYGSLTDSAEPFKNVVSWWSDLARTNAVSLYVVHASSKACSSSPGWQAHDQLTKQAIELSEMSGVKGSVYNSLSTLVSNPNESTSTLVKYYNQEVEPQHILTELEVTKPEKATYTTNETVVIFTGASDPNSPVTINKEAVTTDANGYFTVTMELEGGENTFVIAHKEKTVTYTITRNIEILKDISPQGSIAAEGSMSLSITAWAYAEAEVSATINGSTIQLQVDENALDEAVRDSSYKQFTGQYTVPAAKGSEQNLGNITVSATWQSETKTLTGASVKVNKKAKIGDGIPVVVVADQAKTYPDNTIDNIVNSKYYPLPKGAMDYAVGEEIIYKKGTTTYSYYVLSSGMRISSDQITASEDFASQNSINGMTLSTDNGYTFITMDTAQKVSYSFEYLDSSVRITMHNTVKAPKDQTFSGNPLFTQATWSDGNVLTLDLVKTGGLAGFKGYYDDDGKLVFRFNHPPSSISNARIIIDPGHGGKDTGALGFLADFPEKTINQSIAKLLEAELTSRGATVKMLETTGGMSLSDRVAAAENFNADLFISVHNNTASNEKAVGTESYYFYPYSKTFASSAASNVSGQLETTNRGAKASHYQVTLSPQFPSILVECGFMSNKSEYEKLINDKYQQKIATGIADAVTSAIKSTATGVAASETTTAEKDTSSSSSGSSSESDSSESTSGVTLKLSKTATALLVGKSTTLKTTITPTSASDQDISWSSSKKTVATVDEDGKVTAVAVGTAQITAELEDGTKATCVVTVGKDEKDTGKSGGDEIIIEPESGNRDDGVTEFESVEVDDEDEKQSDSSSSSSNLIKLSATSVTLAEEETKVVKATTLSNVAEDSLTWKSSNSKVAAVEDDGTIVALSSGKTTITVTSSDNSKAKATCTVTVKGDGDEDNDNKDSGDDDSDDDDDDATSKSDVKETGKTSVKSVDDIWFDSNEFTLYKGTSKTLVLVGENSKGNEVTIKNSDLKWESSNTSIATVNSSGVVTAKKKEGTTTISAYTKDEEYYATCKITVTKTKVDVTDITLNKDTLTVAKGMTNSSLEAKVVPSNATSGDLTWRSSNERIATVDSNGVITGRSRGTATITVRSADKKVSVRCKVEVVNEIELDSIELDGDQWEYNIGDEDTLEYFVDPDDFDSVEVIWKSSNPSVVSVDDEGNITAHKKGQATITVSVKSDTSINDKCKIVVYDD